MGTPETDRQTNGQTNRQTNRQTRRDGANNTHTHTHTGSGGGSSGGGAQDEARLDDAGQYVCDPKHRCATPGCDQPRLRPNRYGSVCFACLRARLEGSQRAPSSPSAKPPPGEPATATPFPAVPVGLCGLKAFSSVQALNGHKGRCPIRMPPTRLDLTALHVERRRGGRTRGSQVRPRSARGGGGGAVTRGGGCGWRPLQRGHVGSCQARVASQVRVCVCVCVWVCVCVYQYIYITYRVKRMCG